MLITMFTTNLNITLSLKLLLCLTINSFNLAIEAQFLRNQAVGYYPAGFYGSFGVAMRFVRFVMLHPRLYMCPRIRTSHIGSF